MSKVAASATPPTPIAIDAAKTAAPKKPYPFWLGGVAATIAASITHPLDLTKVRLQASGDKRMVDSIRKTVRTAGVRGLFDGISGTWLRQMSYSMCRFWAYDESKKLIGAGKDAPAWKLAAAGSMARGVGPNVFRAILMNASQLASYDFFKAELLKTKYFEDNIACHFTASFAAGTVATTVCSPADVLKSTLTVIRQSMAKEGAMFMFKGWVPAWTRLQPTTILIFLTLEQLKNAVDFSRKSGFDFL
ncbi:hypothetical protein EST38_g11736 [Candolleomyces aberdarensis]|uniref:Mitochondrial dicarboxylate carrier n=1 Tax=Candolleomyces aberdarensis TaxID=2316362 RepID=A0A4Q2D4U1_9AGAR|nr:hypothetical protein EST38_g11736 [Candolleomyces aberdarensis]